MTENVGVITCPYCKRDIPLDEVLTHQIKDRLQKEFNQEMKKRGKELQEREQGLEQREKGLKQSQAEQEKAMQSYKESVQKEYEDRFTAIKKQAEEEARKKAEDKISQDLKDLKTQLEEKSAQVKVFKESELQLRRDKQKLQEEKQDLELEVARKLDEEREIIRQETIKKANEQHRLKDLEKDKLIEDMKHQVEDLKRKADQGSQQSQGEVLELELESLLKNHFPHDSIEPVPKGMRGADVIQKVCTPSGKLCGTIIWEAKQTKAWSDGWIAKLKEDQRDAKADIAVIACTAFPKGHSNFCNLEGVWVVDYKLATGLALALRSGLVELSAAKSSMVDKNDKMQLLYDYLAGPEFCQQIEGIAEAFLSMKKDLDKEKAAMEKIWAKREKQIEKVIKNTTRMYGSMQGIIGSTLPELKSLELKALSKGG